MTDQPTERAEEFVADVVMHRIVYAANRKIVALTAERDELIRQRDANDVDENTGEVRVLCHNCLIEWFCDPGLAHVADHFCPRCRAEKERDEWKRRAEVLRDELKGVASTVGEWSGPSNWRDVLTSPVLDVIDAMGEEAASISKVIIEAMDEEREA